MDDEHIWNIGDEDPPNNRYDIQVTLTHEAGHFIGLHHSEVAAATMSNTWPHDLSKRSLEEDDKRGCNFLYTPDIGDAPDPFCGGFNYYPSLVHNGAGRVLNGVQLTAPAAGAEHIFGTKGHSDPDDDYLYEWLGGDVSGECESNQINDDPRDDGVAITVAPPFIIFEVEVSTAFDAAGNFHDYDAHPLYLNIWADWGCDCDWVGDQVVGPGQIVNPAVVGFPEFFTFAVPSRAILCDTLWVRARLDWGEDCGVVNNIDGTLAGYRGAAQFGEVEDYPIPNPVCWPDPCPDTCWDYHDPNDLGERDILCVKTFNCDHFWEADSGSFDSVRVAIYVTHDSNTFWSEAHQSWVQDSIAAFTIPLTFWHQPEGCADSVILPTFDYWNNIDINPYVPWMNRSMFRHIVNDATGDTVYNRMLQMVENGKDAWTVFTDIESHSCDGDSGHVFFSLIPQSPNCQRWWEGSNVLLATLTFQVYKSDTCDTTEIGIDSTFWPPDSRLTFTRHDAATYSPCHFLPVKDTIYHIPRLPGDCTGDGVIDVGDVVCLAYYLFSGAPPPDPLCIVDVNCDTLVNIADAVYLINYVFIGGPPPCPDPCSKLPKASGGLKRIE